jgi:decaprenylphospho-beta-D-erythro-pentofuranosid-2-ulose 2-reductase
MSYILIIGAKSDIAKAIAIEYAKHGFDLYLAARNSSELEDFAKDINIRYERKVMCVELDILEYNTHNIFYNGLDQKPIGVISVVGYLGDQSKAQDDFGEAQKIIDTNYTGVVSIINIIADDFEKRKNGFIVGISSVAGDRGRKSNYIYGSSKAALTAYLSGLRNRLYKMNVQVLTVKPGFVNTKMTAGLNLPKKLTAEPKEVAKHIYAAQQKCKNVLYTKWIWKFVMLIIKLIPESNFKKMSI